MFSDCNSIAIKQSSMEASHDWSLIRLNALFVNSNGFFGSFCILFAIRYDGIVVAGAADALV